MILTTGQTAGVPSHDNTSQITYRPFLADELVAAHAGLEMAFGSDPSAEDRDLDLALFTPEQSLGGFDGADIVATAAVYDLPMTLPGGFEDVAGVTWVSVQPTHHRRGILRGLMSRQLSDLHDAGRPLAMLWASEAAIYGRFGYGPGSWHLSVEVKRGAAFVRPVEVGDVRVVFGDAGPNAAQLGEIYGHVVGTRPGWFRRSQPWWDYRLADYDSRRGGMSSLRAVIIEDQGYALYRTKNEWGPGGANGHATVVELVARTPEVEARLWRFLLDLDLTTRVTAWGLPVDSPLLHLVADPRALQPRLSDALWVRLVSVPDALVRRRYAAPVDAVLEVTDATCPWNAGRWRLTGSPTSATCVRSDDPADLTLDVRELGAAFLGGTTLITRAGAGLVEEHREGALAEASLAFSWPGRAPHSPVVF